MEIGFDIEKYLVHSTKVDVSDLDSSAAQRHPLTQSEIRCLTCATHGSDAMAR